MFSSTIEQKLYIEDVIERGGRTFVHIGGDFVLIKDSPVRCNYMRIRDWEDVWVNLYKLKNVFHHFTEDRQVVDKAKYVSFGASEMAMDALDDNIIDAAVVACDGCGTVITNRGEVVQGVGGRMSGLHFTTPRLEVIKRLKREHATVVHPKSGRIDLVGGCKIALKRYKRIAVTITGHNRDILKSVKELDRERVITMVVHNTDITTEDAEYSVKYGDLVWGCASRHVRITVASKALLQLGVAIPVFAFTEAGTTIATSRVKSISPKVGKRLESVKSKIIRGQQHLISFKRSHLTNEKHLTLKKAKLPVLTEMGPRPLI